MKELHFTILTGNDLKKMYQYLTNTKMYRLTNKALSNGYSIGLLEYSGLSNDSARQWFDNATKAVTRNFPGYSYKIGVFTDLSEIQNDKLYFAFKTKYAMQVAHSFCSIDSEGFINNNT